MAKKEDILVIALPVYTDNNKVNGDILLDFMFENDEYMLSTVNSKEELKDFYNNLSKIKLKKSKKMYYHLHAIKDYVENEMKGLYKTMDQRLFDPNQISFLTYEILCTMGVGFFFRIDGAFIAVMPSKLSPKQKRSITELKKYMDDNKFYLHLVENLKTKYDFDNLSYDELLDHLNITTNKKEVTK